MTTRGWFYKTDTGQTRGPLPTNALNSLLEQNLISTQTLIWSGSGEWYPILDIPDFQKIECPFCLSVIPKLSKKCRHCGEWVDIYQKNEHASASLHLSNMSKNTVAHKNIINNQSQKPFLPRILMGLAAIYYVVLCLMQVYNLFSNSEIDMSNIIFCALYGYLSVATGFFGCIKLKVWPYVVMLLLSIVGVIVCVGSAIYFANLNKEYDDMIKFAFLCALISCAFFFAMKSVMNHDSLSYSEPNVIDNKCPSCKSENISNSDYCKKCGRYLRV